MVLNISSFNSTSRGVFVLLLVIVFCLNWFLNYPLEKYPSELVALRGALQPSMGEILSRDVTLLTFVTCQQKIIVIMNIMGEIL